MAPSRERVFQSEVGLQTGKERRLPIYRFTAESSVTLYPERGAYGLLKNDVTALKLKGRIRGYQAWQVAGGSFARLHRGSDMDTDRPAYDWTLGSGTRFGAPVSKAKRVSPQIK